MQIKNAREIALRGWTSQFSPVARLALISCGGIVVLIPFTIVEAMFWLPSQLSWTAAGLVLAAC